MYIRVSRLCMTFVLSVILFLTVLVTPTAHALTISDQDIHEQNLVYLEQQVEALQEQYKLVQMLFIQKLERQIAYLEERLDTQSK